MDIVCELLFKYVREDELLKQFMAATVRFFKELDKITLLVCLSASTLSCACLYSLYKNEQITLKMLAIQIVAVLLGIVAACIISKIDHVLMAKLWKIHVPLTLGLVALTFFIGIAPAGTDDKAWLDFGITTLQPSELLKLSFILTLSLHISKIGENINKLKPFLLVCLHGAIPVGLIMLQGDFGSAIIFFAIFVFMLLVTGLSAKLILTGLVGAAIAAPLIWTFVIPSYLQERFLVALNPERAPNGAGYQQMRGKIAMGSGQLSGRGFFNENIFDVPKAENDFMFSYIGQCLGFVGIIITLLIIVFLCVKILLVAKNSKDKLGVCICTGIFAIFFMQSVINIGMVLCIVPVIGVTLPFFSHGGTSVLVSYMAIGMVMSVYRANKKEIMFQ